MPLLNVSRLPVCPECQAAIHALLRRIKLQRAARDQFRPLEPALAPLGPGKRHGKCQHRRLLKHSLLEPGVFKSRLQIGRDLGQHASQILGRRVHAVVVQPVNQFAQAAVIAAARGGGTADISSDRRSRFRCRLDQSPARCQARGAFAVPRAAEVTGREVLPVDDVYTTGTTATECARVLHRAGHPRSGWRPQRARQDWHQTMVKRPRVSRFQSFKLSKVPLFRFPSLKLETRTS